MAAPDVPPCLRGFEEISRYRDRRDGIITAVLKPGEFYVTRVDERVRTVLGSCVSACIRDPLAGVGGMNHFLLPTREEDSSARYGSFAMEALINGILRHGGSRNRLEVKLFGGARMIEGMSHVGKQNILFVQDYLATEGMEVVSSDIGKDYARHVHYWPVSGRTRMKRLASRERSVVVDESRYHEQVSRDAGGGSVELF